MRRYVLSVDATVVFTVLLLMIAGFVSLTSATDDLRKLTVQTLCYIVGFIVMIALAFWDYRSIHGQKQHIYFLCIFLLAIVFPLGIGKEETGAISWIRFGGIGVQPSEFVKLLFCLYISCELSEKIDNATLNNKKCLIIFLGRCLPIVALVILQNDTGTALVFLFMLAVTLFIAGIKLKYILISLGVALILLPVIWLFMSDYQRDRIIVFFNPNTDISNAGYQVNLSKLALSSGKIFGHGYKMGAVNALSYLPEKETDFIFSVIGEEFGLLGTAFITILFLILTFKCFLIAKNAQDNQGRLIATGISAMFIFHIVENIGMTLGLLPVTGIPLPFISYGGSSVLSMSIAIGLVLSVRRKTYILYHS